MHQGLELGDELDDPLRGEEGEREAEKKRVEMRFDMSFRLILPPSCEGRGEGGCVSFIMRSIASASCSFRSYLGQEDDAVVLALLGPLHYHGHQAVSHLAEGKMLRLHPWV